MFLSFSAIINCTLQFIVIGSYTAFRHFGMRGVDYVNNKCTVYEPYKWFVKNVDSPIGKLIWSLKGATSQML